MTPATSVLLLGPLVLSTLIVIEFAPYSSLSSIGDIAFVPSKNVTKLDSIGSFMFVKVYFHSMLDPKLGLVNTYWYWYVSVNTSSVVVGVGGCVVVGGSSSDKISMSYMSPTRLGSKLASQFAPPSIVVFPATPVTLCVYYG